MNKQEEFKVGDIIKLKGLNKNTPVGIVTKLVYDQAVVMWLDESLKIRYALKNTISTDKISVLSHS
jgi:hypothetical protein